ncbi:uncharacterized protein AMSG_03271 [Thecamonas trahens ATCC 50062]|uniref:Zeta toxin domain-containing protein n=1 Tax=Thecamonas trahens ATCC 50062 TaxID=461836 RepID=A0A0L0D418_THETB|nr:hypothetical protein AMSG_03271 [Thecamonas trahens ATCC 50062]KNC46841.1 hypothetical protein AMSG_03271 [Thecamonas trahens ATCC 50062]|eukprot:XP_013760114.1 hypothetical protein AMSG_03271 [Thecamonas trahens ATCC 50062]
MTTSELYANSGPPVFTGKYARERMPDMIDYSWHVHYTPARQRLHDRIIDEFLAECPQTALRAFAAAAAAESLTGPVADHEPWAIFTAGTMGSGKSYVLRKLDELGVLPQRCFVFIDPDKIRYKLPEMAAYLGDDPTLAGSRTHLEASYIQEVMQSIAFKVQADIIIDGSLRHAGFFRDQLFPRIKAKFPTYRIAIVHVTAERHHIMERVESRAAATGRHIPIDLLEETMAQVPNSVETLTPHVDLVAAACNNDAPHLTSLNFAPSRDPSSARVTPQLATPVDVQETAIKNWHLLGAAWGAVSPPHPHASA